MECDWEVEIASDAPVIDAAWDGFIDLRSDPTRIIEIAEANQFPALAEALIRLNAASSPVWTAKCDVWPVKEFEPGELEADQASALEALGCYIDLLQADQAHFSTLDVSAEWCRRLCLELRGRPIRDCRVDAVIRRAFLTEETIGLGVTVYITACGSSEYEAGASLARAIAVLVNSIAGIEIPRQAL